jgi:hypothetical protein
MLPLRRRSRLVRLGPRPLAVSRRDRRPVVEFAADPIQPDCRHYAALAIIEGRLSRAYVEGAKCNNNHRNFDV